MRSIHITDISANGTCVCIFNCSGVVLVVVVLVVALVKGEFSLKNTTFFNIFVLCVCSEDRGDKIDF